MLLFFLVSCFGLYFFLMCFLFVFLIAVFGEVVLVILAFVVSIRFAFWGLVLFMLILVIFIFSRFSSFPQQHEVVTEKASPFTCFETPELYFLGVLLPRPLLGMGRVLLAKHYKNSGLKVFWHPSNDNISEQKSRVKMLAKESQKMLPKFSCFLGGIYMASILTLLLLGSAGGIGY